MHKNNSFNKSKAEDNYYKFLLEYYSDNDIERNHYTDKYPFRCDFYIYSEDKYIECNYHWTHGGKPYEGTKEDLDKIKLWKSKNTKFYNNAINTWSILDVKKFNISKKNNINYLVFWNIDELKKWIDNYDNN